MSKMYLEIGDPIGHKSVSLQIPPAVVRLQIPRVLLYFMPI